MERDAGAEEKIAIDTKKGKAKGKGKNGKDKGKGAGNKGTIRGFKLVWSDLRLDPEEWIIWVEYSIQCISDGWIFFEVYEVN